MWIYFNPNPMSHNIDDCAIRAICAVFGISWDKAFDVLAESAKAMCLTMDKPAVTAAVLRRAGFYRAVIPNTCPDCYTAADFCRDHPRGLFVLSCGRHVVAVEDGRILDSWNSSDEIPEYYFFKEE